MASFRKILRTGLDVTSVAAVPVCVTFLALGAYRAIVGPSPEADFLERINYRLDTIQYLLFSCAGAIAWVVSDRRYRYANRNGQRN